MQPEDQGRPSSLCSEPPADTRVLSIWHSTATFVSGRKKRFVWASMATQTAERGGSRSSPGIVWAQASDSFPGPSPGRFQVGTWKITIFPGGARSPDWLLLNNTDPTRAGSQKVR